MEITDEKIKQWEDAHCKHPNDKCHYSDVVLWNTEMGFYQTWSCTKCGENTEFKIEPNSRN